MSEFFLSKQFELDCQNGNLTNVQKLVKDGFDLNLYFEKNVGRDSIWSAARSGYLNIVQYLMEQVPCLSEKKNVMLFEMSGKGHLNIVKYLVEIGADIEETKAFTPACSKGHLEIVKYFISEGYDVHKGNDWAFKEACLEGHLEMVQYFITLGVDVNQDHFFAVCCQSGKLEIIKYLIFDLNIKVSEYVRRHLEKGMNTVTEQKIYEMLKLRSLNKKLNKSLKKNMNDTKLKTKI